MGGEEAAKREEPRSRKELQLGRRLRYSSERADYTSSILYQYQSIYSSERSEYRKGSILEV